VKKIIRTGILYLKIKCNSDWFAKWTTRTTICHAFSIVSLGCVSRTFNTFNKRIK